ncbi:sulfite exporter TauE/SafE family protein [Bowmanella sp. Y26]|uniref:sulfite exporter TauE/SafE family protein n=1 Tax=Bowmanella yangjiangensis TaxID=2811230 RepID=UPI001BDC32C8|nr:sulfite exporter TauE/SafE family protein [Bowmanella yangjiangensis]MBT1064690.1 sulfite exporter TauE/SafE family protein [Bowmanella yangjiangensis]
MEWIAVLLAGFLGGLLNAVAGGGSFFTLPALVFAGLPSISANATGTAALLPGYIASAWRFRRDIQWPANMGLFTLSILAIAGGSLGAAVLLVSSEQLFATLIPWLILFATLAFVFAPRLLQRLQSKTNQVPVTTRKSQLLNISILFAVCVYGGYFNGGLGIILLAALGLMGQTNLHGMNGVKNLISALLTSIAVAVYAVGGAISLQHLLVTSIAALAGGYAGAAFAYRIPQTYLRYFIVAVGLGMAFVFFITSA